MSRELGFRAWDRVLSKYVYYVLKNGEIHWNDNNVDSFDYDREPEEQYTGLKDKNGVKIFEGDIINFFSTNLYLNGNIINNTVIFKECAFVATNLKHKILRDFILGNINTKNIVIIGNINENPELLEPTS